MALTPLGGIPSPTRSGDLDPGALLYLLRHKRLDAQALEDGLYRSAGLAGIAGHGDMRVLLADPGPQAQLAVELFAVRIAQSIAAMAMGIGGLDHVVFSGGIGHRRSEEHTSELQSLMRISYAVFCLKKKKKIYIY